MIKKFLIILKFNLNTKLEYECHLGEFESISVNAYNRDDYMTLLKHNFNLYLSLKPTVYILI